MKKYLVILMVLALCLSGVVTAASTPEEVEGVLAGATYLDLRSNNPADYPSGPYVRGGLTLATDGDSWGYPDGSDSWVTVYGKGLDDNSHTAADFSATISGLTAGQTYEVYILATGRSVSKGYDLEWGTSSSSLNLVSPVSEAEDAVVIKQDFDGANDAVELYAIPVGSYEANSSGKLVFWFGSNGGNSEGRTIFDGVAVGEDIDICYLNSASGLAASGSAQQITLDAGDFAPESVTWTQISGPASVTPVQAGDILTYSVTYTVAGDYAYSIEARWDGGTISRTAMCEMTVVDPANYAMIAHWDFEGLPEPDMLIDRANDYDGTFGGGGADGKPNVIAGHISATACDFAGETHWTIDDPYAGSPNFADLGYGLTMAAWLKVDVIGPGRVLVIDDVLEYGVRDDGTAWFNITGTNYYTRYQLADGNWHFFAVTVDPINGEIKFHVDGRTSSPLPIPKTKLFDLAVNTPVLIGNRADLNRAYTGCCDDLKVYNYPLTEAELIALAVEGNLPTCQAVIDAGLTQAADLSGPADVPDCRIDLYDFAAMAQSWLTCVDPLDAACVWPFGEMAPPLDPRAPQLSKIRVAQIKVYPVKGDLQANHNTLMAILNTIEQQEDVDVVITPEGFLDGYISTEDYVSKEDMINYAIDPANSAYVDAISDWSQRNKSWFIFGCTRKAPDGVFNTALIINREGELVGSYDKIHLQTHDYKYTPGMHLDVFDSDFGKFGVMICADRRWPETSRTLALKGAKIIMNPTYGFYGDFNNAMMRTRAYENGIYVAFTHPAQSLITDPDGDITSDNSDSGLSYTVTEVDLSKSQLDERGHLRDRRTDLYEL